MIRNFAVSQRNLVVASLFFSLCVHIRHTHHGDFSTDLIVLTIGDICVFAVAQCLSLYSFPLVTSGLATANGQTKIIRRVPEWSLIELRETRPAFFPPLLSY